MIKRKILLKDISKCSTWSRKNDSPRGCETVSNSEIKVGDEVVVDNHFARVVEDEWEEVFKDIPDICYKESNYYLIKAKEWKLIGDEIRKICDKKEKAGLEHLNNSDLRVLKLRLERQHVDVPLMVIEEMMDILSKGCDVNGYKIR